jgi:hypothetical protein
VVNQATAVYNDLVSAYNYVADRVTEGYNYVEETIIEPVRDFYDEYIAPPLNAMIETIVESEAGKAVIGAYTWFMDEYGHYVEAALIVAGAVTAMTVALPLLTGCAVAGIVVGVLITVGVVIELAYAAAELQEGLTGENYLNEYVFQGNEEAYSMTLMVTELAVGALTIVGGVMNAKQAARAAQGLSNCFIAGTAVLAAVGVVAIEEIEVGDLVWAYDDTTGDVALKEVVQTFENETYELTTVRTNDGQEIASTPTHPYFVQEIGWILAKDLWAGDKLLNVNGDIVIVEWIQHEIFENPIATYNFEVKDYHTYFVGEQGILVHNFCEKKFSDYGVKYKENGTTYKAYHQNGGQYKGQFIAKDNFGHGGSQFKLLNEIGGSKLMLIGDLNSKGLLMTAKHSSNLGKIYTYFGRFVI